MIWRMIMVFLSFMALVWGLTTEAIWILLLAILVDMPDKERERA